MTHKAKVPRTRTNAARGPADPPRVRVRSTPLQRPDESKLALAFYLIAMQLVEDRTDAGSEPPEGDVSELLPDQPERGDAGGDGV